MTTFPAPVLDYWRKTFADIRFTDNEYLSIAVSEALTPKRPAMVLEMNDGSAGAVVRPELARQLAIDPKANLSLHDLQSRLSVGGIALHDPDFLFYLPVEVQQTNDRTKACRLLTEADQAVFDVFYHEASEQDREDAFVELDHWMVVGCFDGNRLVSAASMCLWDDSPVADLGVLTLSDARGKGFASAAVQLINTLARQSGREPQYRCQLDNHASVALAKACGFVHFGKWIVAADHIEQTEQ